MLLHYLYWVVNLPSDETMEPIGVLPFLLGLCLHTAPLLTLSLSCAPVKQRGKDVTVFRKVEAKKKEAVAVLGAWWL